jgi:hypothetical protein
MLSVEIKFKAGDREVSLERFATMFLKATSISARRDQTAADSGARQRSSDTSSSCRSASEHAQGTGTPDRELQKAAFLLGVKESAIGKHVKLGTMPHLRVGSRVPVPVKAINDLLQKGARSVEKKSAAVP